MFGRILKLKKARIKIQAAHFKNIVSYKLG